MIINARQAAQASAARKAFEDEVKIKPILDAISAHVLKSSYRHISVAIPLNEAGDIVHILRTRGFLISTESPGVDLSSLNRYAGSSMTAIFGISWTD